MVKSGGETAPPAARPARRGDADLGSRRHHGHGHRRTRTPSTRVRTSGAAELGGHARARRPDHDPDLRRSRWTTRRAVVHAPPGPAEWRAAEVGPGRPTAAGPALRAARSTTCGAAAGRAGDPTTLPRRRRALVPHPLRPGLLWAARMLLPLGTDLAAGPCAPSPAGRAPGVDPARRGARQDPARAAPARRSPCRAAACACPPVYYGTVDATPLWICLLHDAWRWGMPDARGRRAAAAPRGRARLAARHADPDGDGFLEYLDTSGRGLANQGWKDSGDAVRFRDGRLAEPPIALARCRATPTEAAAGRRRAARRVRPARAATRWRDYAAALAERFRAAFWVDGPRGPLPGDRARRRQAPGRRADQQHRPPARHRPARRGRGAAVAAGCWRAGADGRRLRAAHDVRARTAATARCRYHCGSVWPHDTAIAVAGLARAGLRRAGRAARSTACSRAGRGVRLPAARAVRRRRAHGAGPPGPTRPRAGRRPGRRRPRC